MTGSRGLGPGSLRRDERGRYVLDYRDANRRQRRVVLSEDKRTAERMRADLIKRRDLAEKGLGHEEGMERPLAEVVEAFLVESRATRAEATTKRQGDELNAAMAFLGPRRVRDVTPPAVMEWRRERMKPQPPKRPGEGTEGRERSDSEPRRRGPQGVYRMGAPGRARHG